MLIMRAAAGIAQWAHKMTCGGGDFPAECFDVSGLTECKHMGRASRQERPTVKALPSVESSEGARECWCLCGEPSYAPLAIRAQTSIREVKQQNVTYDFKVCCKKILLPT